MFEVQSGGVNAAAGALSAPTEARLTVDSARLLKGWIVDHDRPTGGGSSRQCEDELMSNRVTPVFQKVRFDQSDAI